MEALALTEVVDRGTGLTLRLVQDVADACADSRSPRTRALYARAWRRFVAFCGTQDKCSPLPAKPETVAAFVVSRYHEGAARNSIALELVAVSVAHTEAGHDSPRESRIVRRAWQGVCRWYARDGRATVRRVAPMTSDIVRAAVRAAPATTAGLRDRALLLILFGAALRRSELVALDVADLRLEDAGLWVHLARSKTDQGGAGADIYIHAGKSAAACPVAAVRAWLEASGVTSGPVFRRVRRGGVVGTERLDPGTVARIVKAHVQAQGLDASTFSGHSGRAGFATSASDAGASMPAIALTTRHRSLTVLASYCRASDLRRQTVRVL